MTKNIYLACDVQEACLVTSEEYDNYADAFIAAITDGKGSLERDSDGYMRAVKNGKPIYQTGSWKQDDEKAKAEVARGISGEINDARYTAITIHLDDNGYLTTVGEDRYGNQKADAKTYGRLAGYNFRPPVERTAVRQAAGSRKPPEQQQQGGLER